MAASRAGATARRIAFLAACVVAGWGAAGRSWADDPRSRSADGVVLQMVKWSNPDVDIPPPVTVFHPRLLPLWLEALEQPDSDLRRQAAEAIRDAHLLGMAKLDQAIEPLTRLLADPDEHPVVKLAIARALISLDARQTAPALAKELESLGVDYAQVVEPALANWKSSELGSRWVQRLSEPGVRPNSLRMALRGVAAIGETAALPRIQELTLSPRVSPTTRVVAAQTWSTLRTEGLEEPARALASDKSSAGRDLRLLAATLLRHHAGEAATAILMELARDSEPTVARIAIERLNESDPRLVITLLDAESGGLATNPDANIRLLAARALASQPTVDSATRLASMLDDEAPDVRLFARRSLVEFGGQAELRAAVVEESRKMLGQESWRGLEQATIVATLLNDKPSAARLVELLDFNRPEVFVTAAWGLRELAVPETLPGMRSRVQRQFTNAKGETSPPRLDEQLAFLMEAFGLMKYADAEPELREAIPKDYRTVETRAAAIWSLGLLHEGKLDQSLAMLLVDRLNDAFSMFPEITDVRAQSAIALGRMEAKAAIPNLRQFYGASADNPVAWGCGWAIQQMTGEPLVKGRPRLVEPQNWFLEPVTSKGK